MYWRRAAVTWNWNRARKKYGSKSNPDQVNYHCLIFHFNYHVWDHLILWKTTSAIILRQEKNWYVICSFLCVNTTSSFRDKNCIYLINWSYFYYTVVVTTQNNLKQQWCIKTIVCNDDLNSINNLEYYTLKSAIYHWKRVLQIWWISRKCWACLSLLCGRNRSIIFHWYKHIML